jgi:hypothetical protein
VLSWLLVALGVLIVAETAWLGGGIGFVVGALFVLAGGARLWVQTRQ